MFQRHDSHRLWRQKCSCLLRGHQLGPTTEGVQRAHGESVPCEMVSSEGGDSLQRLWWWVCTFGFLFLVLKLKSLRFSRNVLIYIMQLVCGTILNMYFISRQLTSIWLHTSKQFSFLTVVFILYPYLGFRSGSDGKGSACNVRDLGSFPGVGKSPGGGSCACCSCLFLSY